MVQINRLRLSGFKSFVDKTELDIGGGLNGIVGPNGCGKSNLVEALRWVMGENRAKQMRSGDMDDVIFAGTSSRPARSIAEVSVLLDNTDGRAPAPFGNSPQIEVTRRIERDKGSQYLVNGKVVRARDVQMLFADALTGAHSPALVSQGRVAQIISAKPGERRQMLEESAGVASLYTRRHEAELRLKAADENLSRLDLVLGEMSSRANSLRNQAKQALRYRELSDTIRRFESLLAWQDWGQTRDRLKKEEARFIETDAQVRDTLLKTTELTTAATLAFEEVEEKRTADIDARAKLQLLRQTADQLEREANHRRHEHQDLVHQLQQAQEDQSLAGEQRAALQDRAAVIASDLEKIAGEDTENPEGLAPLEADYAAALEAVQTAENDVLTLQDRIRRAKSERDAARDALTRAENEEKRHAARLESISQQYDAACIVTGEEDQLAAAQADYESVKTLRAETEEKLAATQNVLDTARDAARDAREKLAALQQDKHAKAREIKSLSDLLARLSEGYEDSLILSLDIPADLAVAVAMAAGDAALRADGEGWKGSANMFANSDWTAGITPLSTLIEAPVSLGAFVSSVGIVDAGNAASLAGTLLRGQVIVTREGQLYRWDGLQAAAAAEDSESRILTLRAQIRDTEAALAAIEPLIAAADAEMAEQNTRRDQLTAELGVIQQTAREAAQKSQSLERTIDGLHKTVNDRAIKRTLLEEQKKQATEQAEAATSVRSDAASAAEAIESLATDETLRGDLQSAEEALAAGRTRRNDLSVQIEALKAAAAQARQLRDSLEAEAKRTAEQIARIGNHNEGLFARIETLQARKTALDPQVTADEAGTERQNMLTMIADGEEAARTFSDAFVEVDSRAKSLQHELKKTEDDGSTFRERRAVIQATVGALQSEQTRIAAEIEERFATTPGALEGAVMAEWPDGVPSVGKARSERDFLGRERDAMGPVNLRAEVELEENETEHARLDAEKIDLAAAIERLREGIGMLNSEARERIVKTFTDVNEHFQRLFKRLFGGGEAYLKLEGDPDPLNCGLEIYAQPPGKSLQSLSLLSGGEQTLTALAMIFAMFLSNPAPVCVLDEVDAPLDDANVDRVCGLLEEMAASCATRFLVITHHRMTMARMNRLYGVTMGERGVSQLVSVNLAAQGELLHDAKAA